MMPMVDRLLSGSGFLIRRFLLTCAAPILFNIQGPHSSAFFVFAEPCAAEPTSNSVPQLTKEGPKACTCCEFFTDFINRNDYVYLLFYSGASNRLNSEILWKFNHLYQEWKHTRIAFAQIDVEADQDLASMYLERGQVPTNIMFLKTQPINVANSDFDKMLKQYHGSAEGSKWLLTKYLGNTKDNLGGNLHYAPELNTVKRFNKTLIDVEATDYLTNSKRKIVKWRAIGFFPLMQDTDKAVMAFREAVWQFSNPKKQNPSPKPSENKPAECHFTYSPEVAVHAGLGRMLTGGIGGKKYQNRDQNAVLRLYGMDDDTLRYGLLREIVYHDLHQDSWVGETLKLLRQKQGYGGNEEEKVEL